MTPNFRNPIIWLLRFRKRCGYGVHSPFAFDLLENVVYERRPYYDFLKLDAQLTWGQRFRVRRYLHLLFRLVNYHQPTHIVIDQVDKQEWRYLTSPCSKAKVTDLAKCRENGVSVVGIFHEHSSEKKLVFLNAPNEEIIKHLHPGDMLLLANVFQHTEWWDSLPSVVSFDLYDVGIAFFDTQYNKQNYVINF